MADRIVINFGADTREVEQAGKRMSDVLDETQDSLDDVGTAGDDSLEKVTKGAEDAADAAEKMGDKVADSGDGFGELEGVADDALGGIGDGLLGLVGIAGGVGGAVSTLVGGAIDIVTDTIKEQQVEAKKLHDDLVGAYVDAGDAGLNYLDTAAVISAASDIYKNANGELDDYREKAALIGVDVNTYVLAQAGSYEDLRVVIEAAGIAAQTAGEVGEDKSKAGQAAALQEKFAVEAVIRANEALLQSHEDGKEAAEGVIDLKETLSQRERDQIKRTQDAEGARFDALAARYEEAAKRGPIVIPITGDDSALEAIIRKPRTIRVGISDIYGRAVV